MRGLDAWLGGTVVLEAARACPPSARAWPAVASGTDRSWHGSCSPQHLLFWVALLSDSSCSLLCGVTALHSPAVGLGHRAWPSSASKLLPPLRSPLSLIPACHIAQELCLDELCEASQGLGFT